MKKIAFVIALSLVSSISGAWMYASFFHKNNYQSSIQPQTPVYRASYSGSGLNFVKASQVSTPSVVFIKTVSTLQYRGGFDGWFFDFDPFGSKGQVSSSGSGVIVTADGYIVTNNHVIDKAESITVVLSNKKKEYKAKLIGTDPSTDLALLKIEAEKLPFIQFANSDDLLTGDWVVAVGNPFNLNSTVTAGIVSAKGRNINILNNSFPIESFIQTDAAINPGNSGGALVNLEGQLVGINTAIASNTGSYNGYGFAIPCNIVSKIVKDLKEFGEVQRGFPGCDVDDISSDEQEKIAAVANSGVKVIGLLEESPAQKSGLKEGDIILKVNGKMVDSKSIYDEQIAYLRPGDKATFSVWRLGEVKEIAFSLLNKDGSSALMKKNSVTSSVLGADFQPVSAVEKQKYGIKDGIKVSNIKNGRMARFGIDDGFIITKFNNKSYTEPEDFISDLESAKGNIVFEGIDSDGVRRSMSFYGY